MIPTYLFSDFLSWLWWISESGGTYSFREGDEVQIVLDSKISFRDPNDDKAGSSFKGQICADARQSFAIGRQIESALVSFQVDDRLYEVRFGKHGLSSFKVCLPLSGEGEISSAVHENLLCLDELETLLQRLFVDFLHKRAQESEELLSQVSTLASPPEA